MAKTEQDRKDETASAVEEESRLNDEIAATHREEFRKSQEVLREPDDEKASPSQMRPAPPADPAFLPRTGGTKFDRKLEEEQATVAEGVASADGQAHEDDDASVE